MHKTRKIAASKLSRLHRSALAVVPQADKKTVALPVTHDGEPEPLLSARISVDYPGRPGVLRDFALDVRRGEILGLVGQSGSGKSTLALALLRLLAWKGASMTGRIVFAGRDLMQLSEGEMRAVRGREIALVLQNPLSSLNPALRIGTQLREVWRAHETGGDEQFRFRVRRLFRDMSLPGEEEFLRRFPRQLSTGQAQRVLIAMAVLLAPKLIIADEPTSALDAITHAETTDLFARLNRELGTTVLFISHDLMSVAALCDRIAILHEGQIVECGDAEAVFEDPRQPYTRRLIEALPKLPPGWSPKKPGHSRLTPDE